MLSNQHILTVIVTDNAMTSLLHGFEEMFGTLGLV